jgi:hypothetical protein
MRLAARKYLYDIKQAADLLGEFTGGKQFSDYTADRPRQVRHTDPAFDSRLPGRSAARRRLDSA